MFASSLFILFISASLLLPARAQTRYFTDFHTPIPRRHQHHRVKSRALLSGAKGPPVSTGKSVTSHRRAGVYGHFLMSHRREGIYGYLLPSHRRAGIYGHLLLSHRREDVYGHLLIHLFSPRHSQTPAESFPQ